MKEYSKGIYVKFKPEEVEILHDRMKEAGVQNMSAYIRKMAINGYVIIPEWPDLNRVISLHARISNNLNQYAKKANETGKLYEEDIAEIKKILRKAEYTEDVPEKITETVWKEEESEYMSIPVENKKKGILRLWQQKEQNIFGRIRKLLQGGKIPEKKVEPFVFEPEPEINMHQQNPTVLLADLPKKEYGILKYEGNGTCSELSIDHTPYIIGSELDCDGVIPSGTVSRHHARITRKGEVYFIEDLNSSNGTMVGGELLNCRVKMSLQAQETVMFADEKFRFI